MTLISMSVLFIKISKSCVIHILLIITDWLFVEQKIFKMVRPLHVNVSAPIVPVDQFIVAIVDDKRKTEETM